MHNQRFTRDDRIRRTADFQKVYRRRARASDDVIVVCGCENELDRPRLGLSVSRKVGSATVRNRWKRLVREAFRLTRENLPAGVDLVVIPRPEAEPRLDRLRESLVRLAARAARRLDRDRK